MEKPTSPRGLFPLLALLGLVSSCDRNDGSAVEPGGTGSPASSRPPAVERLPYVAPPEQGATRFVELTAAETGVDFVNPIDESHPLRYLYASAMSTGGAAIADVDGNGAPDIFLAGGPGENKLFRQTGRLTFEDVTSEAGVAGGDRWAVGSAFADIDNDGDSDLYVCNYLSPNQLFLNQGDGTFEEVAEQWGVAFSDASHTPSFCDYDGDGDLDLYVLTNRWYRPEGFPQETTIETGPDGRPRVLPKFERFYAPRQVDDDRWESMVVGRPDLLCRNNGSGSFEVVNETAGIGHRGHGLSATWWDWNGDGWTDLWVGNDFDDQDHLYMNRGDGTFLDVTEHVVGHLTWFSMGADFGDLNSDGLPDFLIADMAGSNHFKQKTAMGSMDAKKWFLDNAFPAQIMRNSLYLNAGNGRFLEGAYLAGLANTDWTWAVRLNDFDHDGRNDAFFQCGMSRNFNERDDEILRNKDRRLTQWERYRHLPPLKEKNRAFRNLGEMKFADVSEEWGLDHLGMSYGCAVGDLDRDGSLDIVSVRLDEQVVIYHNTGGSSAGNSLSLSLRGTKSNRQGLGAQVTLYPEGAAEDAAPLIRTVNPYRGYLGSDQPIAHFGLGQATAAARIEILWPSGDQQVLENLEAGAHYVVTEQNTRPWAGPQLDPSKAMFARAGELSGIVHREEPFDDFEREPLLPNKLSQLGPAQAWADVDGDGMEDDFFLGMARGMPRRIYLGQDDGTFEARPLLANDPDLESEDMGALFFDSDGDGDLDLYVVSGGVECDEGASTLQDRLYLNDGTGRFDRAPSERLPSRPVNGSCVAAADFDRDGDLDLFVGGRSVPGHYPLAENSQLLRNDGGRFTDQTLAVAPALASAKAGIVTGAVWTDVDDDGWIDLALSRDWDTLLVLRNEEGTLVPLAQTAGLEKVKGWWNAVAAGDLDGDGDFDLVATNFGRNTKYHPKPERPVVIFYGDLDGTGRSHIIEAEYEGDILYPIRGKSCSTQAIPSLADKFSTFREFAAASLQEIYGEDKLKSARRFEVTKLDTAVFWNDGKGDFQPEALPWVAQVAPSFGVAIRDMDGNGTMDIVLAQNFFTPQRETGRMAGGLSLLLLGTRDGDQYRFEPVWPHRSGIAVSEDAMSLAVPDLDRDGAPDLVFGNNNSPLRAYLNRSSGGRHLAVRLTGTGGNKRAIGARVIVNGRHAAEVRSGEGYLSQAPSTLSIGLEGEESVRTVEVRWPDGTSTRFDNPPVQDKLLELVQPAGASASR